MISYGFVLHLGRAHMTSHNKRRCGVGTKRTLLAVLAGEWWLAGTAVSKETIATKCAPSVILAWILGTPVGN